MTHAAAKRIFTRLLILVLTVLIVAPEADAARRRRSSRRKATTAARAPRQKAVTGPMAAHEPFVTFESDLPAAPQGLDGRIIAVWQSHGLYYDQGSRRWQWQRPRLFGTVEDLFTQGFVMPYLMPMLENAGAYVMSPRERDLSTMEIIIDTDGMEQGDFYLTEGTHKWKESEVDQGYAWPQGRISEFDNPFADGTYEKVAAVGAHDTVGESTANWTANIPRRGHYAVYVSYKSLANSAPDALYTINHLGGSTRVRVNQKMGGGTWIYLGHYHLDAGTPDKPIVELTNRSAHKGVTVTADAVKIGGGMGTVARSPGGEIYDSSVRPEVSGYPRFAEGARYWLQWAGMPVKVYSQSNGENDYTDDYKSRAEWVNYLAGGSVMLPDSAGLKIPVDMAFAFHTDAGVDSLVVGTMGIYSTDGGNLLGNRRSRSECADLTYTVINQVVADIRALHLPTWPLRKVKDARYYEIRQTKVPAMIIELLSHQNFEDMKYGLDPQFRFDVSRAVYKGILRFLSARSGENYTVTPLAPKDFAITCSTPGTYRLRWQPTVDPLEKTAVSRYYVVEERVADGVFIPVATVNEPQWSVEVPADGVVRSYRVIAGNEGGRSFPTSPLALCNVGDNLPDVNIVDGFTRISAPGTFSAGDWAGFNFASDPAIADGIDIITTGPQYDFLTFSEYETNDNPGFGASKGDWEKLVMAGNTRDYVAVHGRSLAAARVGFVSSQASAFATEVGEGWEPPMVDLLLGNQRRILTPSGQGTRFDAFPAQLRTRITEHLEAGGSLLVTGSYIGSELFDNGLSDDHEADHAFARMLGYDWSQAAAGGEGRVSAARGQSLVGPGSLEFNIDPLAESYAVTEADAVRPVAEAIPLLIYDTTGLTAAVASERRVTGTNANCRVVAIGFPFETIISERARHKLMKQLTDYLLAQ